MRGEINIDSIRALDEQIKELEEALTKLKRTRNSLLNAHRLPPEILGKVFQHNIMPESDFGGLDKRSHNFLFVCHHWSEVASHTPELWGFWGNTTRDWLRWYSRSAIAPLDLILTGADRDCYFDRALFDELQDRASRDIVRRVHLRSGDSQLLNSVLSSLTSECEDIRSDQMESLILRNLDDVPVDVSNFFVHHYFPKLQRLNLTHCKISSWDLLRSRTGALTELYLDFIEPSLTPPTSQLLSILASNPSLRKVTLLHQAVPQDSANTSPFRAPLRHLRQLILSGESRHVFGLLQRLVHRATLDKLAVTLPNCKASEVSQIIGPYLRRHLQRRGRPPSGIGLSLPHSGNHIVFNVGEGGRIHLGSVWMDKAVTLSLKLGQSPPKRVLEKAALDLMTYVPREDITHFWGISGPVGMGDIYTRLPNLKMLCLYEIHLPAVFPEPNSSGNGDVPPSLQALVLPRLKVEGGNWTPLTTFLAYRASNGKQLNTLQISSDYHIRSKVVESIEGMVQKFSLKRVRLLCSSGIRS